MQGSSVIGVNTLSPATTLSLSTQRGFHFFLRRSWDTSPSIAGHHSPTWRPWRSTGRSMAMSRMRKEQRRVVGRGEERGDKVQLPDPRLRDAPLCDQEHVLHVVII